MNFIHKISFNTAAKFSRFIGIYALSMSLFSCEQVIDIELPEHVSQPVLNGMLIAGDSILSNSFNEVNGAQSGFNLSRSQGLNRSRQPIDLILNGRITIEENGQGFEVLSTTDGGFYRPSQQFTPGATYSVRAEMPDGTDGPYIENVHMPIKTQFTNVQTRETNRSFDIDITFDDPIGENFYFIEVFQVFEDTFNNFSFINYLEFNALHPDFASYFEEDPFEPEGGSINGVLRDQSFDGQSLNLRIRVNTRWSGPINDSKIYISWLSMTKDMDRFKSIYYTPSGGFLSEPVPFFFNVENGLGTVVSGTRTLLRVQ